MLRVSEIAQIETAVQAALMLLRRRGDVPYITRSSWRKAVRILHLDASSGVSWRSREDLNSYLEAAGFDGEGTIVDYEKFYAHLDAHKKRAVRRSA